MDVVPSSPFNPRGADFGLESVTLLNITPDAIDLTGWAIADKNKNKTYLEGIIGGGDFLKCLEKKKEAARRKSQNEGVSELNIILEFLKNSYDNFGNCGMFFYPCPSKHQKNDRDGLHKSRLAQAPENVHTRFKERKIR